LRRDMMDANKNIVGIKGIINKANGSVLVKVYLATVILYAVSCIIQPNYLSWKYIMDTLVAASFLGIMCVGQTLVILTGGIDLSIAVTFNLAAVITASMQNENQLLMIGILLLTGVVIGLINGLGVVFLDVPPIVMTLAMQSILLSAVYLYTKGLADGASPKWVRFIATQSILNFRIALILWIFITVMVIFLLTKTTWGRKIYAIGINRNVAFYSGVNNNCMIISVYILSSVFAVIAGLFYTGYLGYAYIGMGSSYLMLSIAAVVIGGTASTGGIGGYSGTVAGAIIIYILNGLLVNMKIQEGGKYIVNGLIILAVLLIYGRSKKE